MVGGPSSTSNRLEGGLDFKTPGLKQRLRDVLGILISARPLAQPGRTKVLVRSEFVLLYHLLKLGYGGDNRADRLGLAPIWIAASFSHEYSSAQDFAFNRLRFR